MYKFTDEGVVKGRTLRLTAEDLKEILKTFSESQGVEFLRKTDGVWRKGREVEDGLD
jgi:hypothetical protein